MKKKYPCADAARPTLASSASSSSCLGMRPSQVAVCTCPVLLVQPSIIPSQNTKRLSEWHFLQCTTPLPSFHFLLQLLRGPAVTVCFLLQLFWYLPLLSVRTCCYLSAWNMEADTNWCVLCCGSTGIGVNGTLWSLGWWGHEGGGLLDMTVWVHFHCKSYDQWWKLWFPGIMRGLWVVNK